MKVVILCGGQGTRLREETEFKPKPLVEIGGKPILWHIMKTYSHFGFNEFILCLGYKGHLIKDYFLNYENRMNDFELNLKDNSIKQFNGSNEDWKIIFAETGLKTNTGGRIKRIEKYIDGDEFLLTYGDGVADVDINKVIEFHKTNKAVGTVTAVRPLARFGLLKYDDKNCITDFTKKNLVADGRIDGGFFVFNKSFFKYLSKDEDCVLEGKPLKDLAKNGKLFAYNHDGFWQCMDTISQSKYLNEIWKSNKAPWKTWD